jgi:hypothetical protein
MPPFTSETARRARQRKAGLAAARHWRECGFANLARAREQRQLKMLARRQREEEVLRLRLGLCPRPCHERHQLDERPSPVLTAREREIINGVPGLFDRVEKKSSAISRRVAASGSCGSLASPFAKSSLFTIWLMGCSVLISGLFALDCSPGDSSANPFQPAQCQSSVPKTLFF